MEFFSNIGKIEYKGKDSTDPLSFKYYNPRHYARTTGWLHVACTPRKLDCPVQAPFLNPVSSIKKKKKSK